MGPLHGLRVIELAAIGPAPFACMLLADLGAEVIRVDRTDGQRAFPEAHRLLERGRRSIALDLKSAGGADALLRLADRADVLIEGYRPGVMERLGIGPAVCLERNHRLVYGRMTGWGQQGPLAREPGHDINYLALSGALDTMGRAGEPPVPPLNLLGDFAGGGLLLATGVLAALQERHHSGRGQVVDAAIVDGVAAMMGTVLGMAQAGQWQYRRESNLLDGGAPFYTTYGCADGRAVAVGALEPRFWAALLHGLGLDPGELPDRDDRRHWPRLRRILAARFARRDRDAWAEAFSGTEACVTPVLTVEEAAEHPHNLWRGTYPVAHGLRQPAPAPRFSRSEAGPPARPACQPGADTVAVLGEHGFDAEEIRQLLASGAAALPPPACAITPGEGAPAAQPAVPASE